MANPFAFMGNPVRVPVSATSANNEFFAWDLLPNIPDLSVMVMNPNPFDVRILSVRMMDDGVTLPDFVPVNANTGILTYARSFNGPFTSSRPVYISVQAFATPGQPLPDPGYDYSDCWIELAYGRGE